VALEEQRQESQVHDTVAGNFHAGHENDVLSGIFVEKKMMMRG
jgi:hypothetical protein